MLSCPNILRSTSTVEPAFRVALFPRVSRREKSREKKSPAARLVVREEVHGKYIRSRQREPTDCVFDWSIVRACVARGTTTIVAEV